MVLTVGRTLTLKAIVDADETVDKTVSWTTDKPDIAMVDNGIVTAVGEGTANITVTTNKGKKMATCIVTVISTTPKQMTMTTAISGDVRIDMAGLETGTVIIDWGDGSEIEHHILYTLRSNSTGTGIAPENRYTHSYSDANSRTITITSENITYLVCNGIQLTDLDVSENTALTILQCGSNELKSLNVSKNSALTHFYCYFNHQLTNLDVSKNTALTFLSCGGNQLTSLDVSKNTALTILVCGESQLKSLDVSKNVALTELHCSDNQFTSLVVSKNTMLKNLGCSGNQITNLDVSKNTMLWELNCSNNELTSLDLSKNTNLGRLYCINNRLKNLDVSKNSLVLLYCSNNELTSLNMSSASTMMHMLNCQNNRLAISAMNALFETLPRSSGFIIIGGNAGTVDCNRSIASNKGWTVLDNW